VWRAVAQRHFEPRSDGPSRSAMAA